MCVEKVSKASNDICTLKKHGNLSIHVIKHLIITCKNVRMFLLWAYKQGWGMTREIGKGKTKLFQDSINLHKCGN